MALKYVVPAHHIADGNVISFLQNKEKLAAIRYIRTLHSLSLKEAKDIVDKMSDDIKANPALLMTKRQSIELAIEEIVQLRDQAAANGYGTQSFEDCIRALNDAMWVDERPF
jgi:hypothetical protein